VNTPATCHTLGSHTSGPRHCDPTHFNAAPVMHTIIPCNPLCGSHRVGNLTSITPKAITELVCSPLDTLKLAFKGLAANAGNRLAPNALQLRPSLMTMFVRLCCCVHRTGRTNIGQQEHPHPHAKHHKQLRNCMHRNGHARSWQCGVLR
jgi:hypothetical protein